MGVPQGVGIHPFHPRVDLWRPLALSLSVVDKAESLYILIRVSSWICESLDSSPAFAAPHPCVTIRGEVERCKGGSSLHCWHGDQHPRPRRRNGAGRDPSAVSRPRGRWVRGGADHTWLRGGIYRRPAVDLRTVVTIL